MGIDNRKQKRVILKKVVTIDKVIKAIGLDLSIGGLYIQTGRSFPVGTTVVVGMQLYSEPITVCATVQHAEEAFGMGLQFTDLTPGQTQTIEKYVNANVEKPSVVAEKKILIVDDSVTIRKTNMAKLAEDGLFVVEAGDGMEAIAMLAKENIQLVILDLNMVPFDGYKVLAMMRQNPAWSKIPVIVFSALNTSAEIDKAIGLGATEFLPKLTTNPAKLSERVKLHLSSKS